MSSTGAGDLLVLLLAIGLALLAWVAFRSIPRLLLRPQVRRGKVLEGARVEVGAARPLTREELLDEGAGLRGSGQTAFWLDLQVEPRSSSEPWRPDGFELVPVTERARPTWRARKILGSARCNAAPRQGFRGPATLRLLMWLRVPPDGELPEEARLVFWFTPLATVRLPAGLVTIGDELAGLGCAADDARQVLVRAAPEEVAGAVPAGWVFRLNGHLWSVWVAPGEAAAGSLAGARELSAKLGTEAVLVEHSDTAGATGFARFRGGELVEVYGSGEVSAELRRLGDAGETDPFFTTPGHAAPRDRLGQPPERFVDRALRELGAFAPPPIWRFASNAGELAAAAAPHTVTVARSG